MAEKKRHKTVHNNYQCQDEKNELKLKCEAKANDFGGKLEQNSSTVTSLPPELLEIIFNKVENPKDLLSCWNTTSVWAAVLRTTDFYFQLTLPFLLPYFNRSDLLVCSSVSKSWNGAVDSCMQTSEEDGSEHRLDEEQRIVQTFGFTKIRSFIKRFDLSGNLISGEKPVALNRVAFQRVKVEFKFVMRGHADPERWNDFIINDQAKLKKCLNYCGHLIRHLHLDVSGDVDDFAKLKLVRSCLKRTPNLHVLHITATKYGYMPENGEIEREEFNVFISHNPWPALKYLKVVKLSECTDREALACLANAYAPQLLYLQFGFPLTEEPRSPLINGFSCLQKIVYFVGPNCCGKEFGAFVQSNKCPLKYLSIVISTIGDDDVEREQLDGLTVAANAASPTLETLKLTFLNHDNDREKLNFVLAKFKQLRLARLQELELTGFGYPSLDDLQSVCPGLQTLIISPAIPDCKNLTMMKARELYFDLYSQHEFWKTLANIQSVDVRYNYGETMSRSVRMMRKTQKVWKQLSRCCDQAIFTRRIYESLVREDCVMADIN